MLIIGKHSLASFLRVFVDVLLVVNILVLIFLPRLLTFLYENPVLITQLDLYSRTDIAPGAAVGYPSDLPANSYPFYLAFFYASGIGTAWLLLEGHLILRRLENGNPFAAAQSHSFFRVACACGILLVTFIAKVLTYNTLLTSFCTIIFLLLVLIALILSEVFRQAHQVKSENELTI